MEPNAAGLSTGETREIALYHSGLPKPPPPPPSHEMLPAIQRGEAMARRGIPTRRVPSCVSCHGHGPRNPVYPDLTSQYADYLVLQLELFKRQQRGTAYAHLMRTVSANLTPEQMRDVALYYASPSSARERPSP